MAGFNQYHPPYSSYALEVTWRLSYAIGLIPLISILLYRVFHLRESAVWQKKREALRAMGGAKASGVQWRKFSLLMRYYWHRNFGTAMSWFVWDFAFYGNKVRGGEVCRHDTLVGDTCSLRPTHTARTSHQSPVTNSCHVTSHTL